MDEIICKQFGLSGRHLLDMQEFVSKYGLKNNKQEDKINLLDIDNNQKEQVCYGD